MPLDPQVSALLSAMRAKGRTPLAELPVAEVRDRIDALADLMGRAETVAGVSDHVIAGPAGPLAIRAYVPESPVAAPPPLVLYVHGGGWIGGSIDSVDVVARSLAHESGAVVCTVDYGLAPEHPYPAAAEEICAAIGWAQECAADVGANPDRVVAVGDSAGGNLVAAAALMARDRGCPPISLQVLLYPALDVRLGFPSCTENGAGYVLHLDDMRHYWRTYLGGADGSEPYASPLRATSLSGLPPAFVATCEYDLLRDEGDAYAERLRAAGVRVEHRRYEGQPHALLWLGGVIDAGVRMRQDIARAIRAVADR